MGGIARLALRHPVLRLTAVACVAACVPGVAFAAAPDPSPAHVSQAGPRPDAAPSGRALAQPARPAAASGSPVRTVVVVPSALRVVRVVTPAPSRPLTKARTATPRRAKPAPAKSARAPKPEPQALRVAGEPREAIVRAVVASTTDTLPLFLAAAGLACFALAGGGLALAVGRELRAL